MRATCRVHLFSEQTERRREAAYRLEGLNGLLVLADRRQRLRQPERTRQERAFSRLAIRRQMTVEERRSGIQLALDTPDRPEHARIVAFVQPDERQDEQRGVGAIVAVCHAVPEPLGVPSGALD